MRYIGHTVTGITCLLLQLSGLWRAPKKTHVPTCRLALVAICHCPKLFAELAVKKVKIEGN